MQTATIDSFAALLTAFRAIPSDADLCYRGQSNASWALVPTIFRGLDSVKPVLDADELKLIASIERDLYREFNDRAVRHIEANDKWLLLSHAQHYGTPTRLLDWSANRLVAIYFAVSEHFDSDAAIWSLDMAPLDSNVPKLLGRRMRGRGFRCEVMPKSNISFFEAVSTMPSAEPILHLPNFFAVFQPPDIDDRLVNQKSLFTVQVSFNRDNTDTDIVLDHQRYILQLEQQTNRHILWKFIVPKEYKLAIYRDLQKMGIDPSSLFPDLVGIGQYLNGKRLERMKTEILDCR